MSYHEDWLMRQIATIAQFIARAVFHKDAVTYEINDEYNLTSTDLLHTDIKTLVADRQLCQAEDLLYENLDTEDMRHLEMAIDFYHSINQLSDETLSASNFSREEINEGMETILKQFGMDHLL